MIQTVLAILAYVATVVALVAISLRSVELYRRIKAVLEETAELCSCYIMCVDHCVDSIQCDLEWFFA